jgi:TrmH family RNA methyltransferase
LTTVEGPFLLGEAIAGGVSFHDVFALPDDAAAVQLGSRAGIEITQVAPDVLKSMASSVSPRGPIAVISVPEAPQPRRIDTIVLWKLGDPGNAGTIIRTAAALGFQVIATEGTVDLWAPKVLRAAVGGHFRAAPVERFVADPQELIELGLRPILAVADAELQAEDAVKGQEPIAIIVGNEAHGAPDGLNALPGVESMSLAMPGGMESLNAAVAASILMYLRISC